MSHTGPVLPPGLPSTCRKDSRTGAMVDEAAGSDRLTDCITNLSLACPEQESSPPLPSVLTFLQELGLSCRGSGYSDRFTTLVASFPPVGLCTSER